MDFYSMFKSTPMPIGKKKILPRLWSFKQMVWRSKLPLKKCAISFIGRYNFIPAAICISAVPLKISTNGKYLFPKLVSKGANLFLDHRTRTLFEYFEFLCIYWFWNIKSWYFQKNSKPIWFLRSDFVRTVGAHSFSYIVLNNDVIKALEYSEKKYPKVGLG